MPIMDARIESARAFAARAHAAIGQTYGEQPYTVHLDSVFATLGRFGADAQSSLELLQAAYLHDVVEDCPVNVDEVRDLFGARVAELVWAVTNEDGANRKERQAKTYPKTRSVPGATRLKLGDRIANVEACLADGASSSLFGMYQREHAVFESALRVPGENEDMWEHLDALIARREIK